MCLYEFYIFHLLGLNCVAARGGGSGERDIYIKHMYHIYIVYIYTICI